MFRPMQLQELTEATRISLFHAGWDEQRRWNPEEVALAHLECGLELHDQATRFLRRLGAGRPAGEILAAVEALLLPNVFISQVEQGMAQLVGHGPQADALLRR